MGDSLKFLETIHLFSKRAEYLLCAEDAWYLYQGSQSPLWLDVVVRRGILKPGRDGFEF